jgi:RNA polymerase sigma factor (sigma-70 family)
MERAGTSGRVPPVNLTMADGPVNAGSASPADTVVLAFDDFYRQARSDVARALSLALGDPELAAEATDEAMTRAYARWRNVSALDNPGGWVYRVGLNWSLSVLRRRRRSRQPLYDPDRVDLPALADPDIHRALAELDVKHRSVVVCRHLLGWTADETATALGVRVGTVKSRLHRANRLLQTRLDHLRPGEER